MMSEESGWHMFYPNSDGEVNVATSEALKIDLEYLDVKQ